VYASLPSEEIIRIPTGMFLIRSDRFSPSTRSQQDQKRSIQSFDSEARDDEKRKSMMNILDHVAIRLPCKACGQSYEVPLSDVLLSHTMIRCGCPVERDTECPPIYQIRLFDREPIEVLNSAWQTLARGAHGAGGELVILAGNKNSATDKRSGEEDNQ
jgi:hypothetical protein